jgi:hypothetical protein
MAKQASKRRRPPPHEAQEPIPQRSLNPNDSRPRRFANPSPMTSAAGRRQFYIFDARSHSRRQILFHSGFSTNTWGRKLRALPAQQLSRILVYQPRLVGQRRIRSARAPRMLALPALPAPLIIPKAKRTVRAPISAPRTRRRYPVVRPPSMLAPSADRHTSRLYQNPPPPATSPASSSTSRRGVPPLKARRPAFHHYVPQPDLAPRDLTTKPPFTAYRHPLRTILLSKSVMHAPSIPRVRPFRNPCFLFSISVSCGRVKRPCV